MKTPPSILDTELIDIPSLLDSGQRDFKIEARFSYSDLPSALEGTTPLVEVTGKLHFHQSGFELTGHMMADADQACYRCGEGFVRHIQEDFSESLIFVQFANQKLTGEVELNADDFYETVSENDAFDLKQLVQDLLIIAMSYDAYCPTCRL